MNKVTKASGSAGKVVANEPAHPMASFRNEIDRFFESFDQGWPFGAARRWFDLPAPAARGTVPAARPATDISEHEGAYEIALELPGMEEKDIEVNLDRGMLTITGEKKEERSEKKKDYHLTERRFGSYRRAFALPENVAADRIEASFKQGVLTVTLPKTAETKPDAQRIAVKAG